MPQAATTAARQPPPRVSGHQQRSSGQQVGQKQAGEKPLPPHYLKNKFILKGYVTNHSPWSCLSTLYRRDNETMNVHTNLLGLAACAWAANALLVGNDHPTPLPAPANKSSEMVIWLVLALFVLNLLASTFYHALASYAPLYHIMSAVDLIGISFPACALALALACDVRVVPTAAADLHPWNIVLPVWAFIVAVMASSFTYRVKIGRESPFWLLCLNVCPYWVLVPLYLFARGANDTLVVSFVVLLVAGLLCFATKVPERFYPGVFDTFGNSHNLWHALYITSFGFMFVDCCCTLSEPELNRLAF